MKSPLLLQRGLLQVKLSLRAHFFVQLNFPLLHSSSTISISQVITFRNDFWSFDVHRWRLSKFTEWPKASTTVMSDILNKNLCAISLRFWEWWILGVSRHTLLLIITRWYLKFHYDIPAKYLNWKKGIIWGFEFQKRFLT